MTKLPIELKKNPKGVFVPAKDLEWVHFKRANAWYQSPKVARVREIIRRIIYFLIYTAMALRLISLMARNAKS